MAEDVVFGIVVKPARLPNTRWTVLNEKLKYLKLLFFCKTRIQTDSLLFQLRQTIILCMLYLIPTDSQSCLNIDHLNFYATSCLVLTCECDAANYI